MDARRDVFQAIADPTRRNILATLLPGPQNVNAIAAEFKITRQAVSLHVKILVECGVISITQQGRERVCQLKPKELETVMDWLEPFRKLWETRFDQLDDVLSKLNK